MIGLSDESTNAILIKCTVANMPTGAGYAIGCVAIATDSGNLYTNTGTASAATFTQLAAGGGGSIAIPYAQTDSISTTGNSFSNNMTALTTGSGFIGTVATGRCFYIYHRRCGI